MVDNVDEESKQVKWHKKAHPRDLSLSVRTSINPCSFSNELEYLRSLHVRGGLRISL